MKITAIKQQVKNPERVSVFVNEKYSFSLSLNELADLRLVKDQELSSADVKKYKQLSADGKLRARTLEWLLNRPHSTRELRDYLYHKKAEPEMIDGLTAEFTAKGYLDDAKYGRWLLELRQRKGKSNRAIRAELFKKDLGREVIDELLASQAGNEAARLKALIAKKRKLPRYRRDPEKLKSYLVGQGFGWDQVKEALADRSPQN